MEVERCLLTSKAPPLLRYNYRFSDWYVLAIGSIAVFIVRSSACARCLSEYYLGENLIDFPAWSGVFFCTAYE